MVHKGDILKQPKEWMALIQRLEFLQDSVEVKKQYAGAIWKKKNVQNSELLNGMLYQNEMFQ